MLELIIEILKYGVLIALIALEIFFNNRNGINRD
jgi:hypothetical protein